MYNFIYNVETYTTIHHPYSIKLDVCFFLSCCVCLLSHFYFCLFTNVRIVITCNCVPFYSSVHMFQPISCFDFFLSLFICCCWNLRCSGCLLTAANQPKPNHNPFHPLCVYISRCLNRLCSLFFMYLFQCTYMKMVNEKPLANCSKYI